MARVAEQRLHARGLSGALACALACRGGGKMGRHHHRDAAIGGRAAVAVVAEGDALGLGIPLAVGGEVDRELL